MLLSALYLEKNGSLFSVVFRLISNIINLKLLINDEGIYYVVIGTSTHWKCLSPNCAAATDFVFISNRFYSYDLSLENFHWKNACLKNCKHSSVQAIKIYCSWKEKFLQLSIFTRNDSVFLKKEMCTSWRVETRLIIY